MTYIYDSADRLVEVRNNGAAFATSFSYDLGGRLASFVTGGVTHTLSYDLRDRVQQLRALGPGGGLDLTYSYDKTRLVAGITDPRGGMSQSFGYDALSRLTSATGPWSPLSWTYDAIGNRRTEARGGSTTTYTYDAVTQRLQTTSGAAGSESFTYTAARQLASDGVGTYLSSLKTYGSGSGEKRMQRQKLETILPAGQSAPRSC